MQKAKSGGLTALHVNLAYVVEEYLLTKEQQAGTQVTWSWIPQ